MAAHRRVGDRAPRDLGINGYDIAVKSKPSPQLSLAQLNTTLTEMHFFPILLAVASLTGALAKPCSFYPGTNITDSFNGLFTMKVVDAATGNVAPLNLGTVITQPDSTWSVLQVSINNV